MTFTVHIDGKLYAEDLDFKGVKKSIKENNNAKSIEIKSNDKV